MKVISDKTNKVTTKYRKVKREVHGFIVKEVWVDDVLASQDWLVKGGFSKTHPTMYEPKHAMFSYYPDCNFLESESNVNMMSFYREIPDPDVVLDWDDFDINKVLFVSLGMDGCIYQINKKEPIALWRHKDYIAGFTNKDYDLTKLVKLFEKRDWIRNVEIIDIPHYNCDEDRTKAVHFDYKLPSKKHLQKKLGHLKLFKDHYFGL